MKLFLFVIFAAITVSAHAEVYKCKDAKGKTIYQETPCEAANLKEVGKVAKPVGSASQEAIEKSQAEIKAFNERYADRKKAAQKAEELEYQREMDMRNAEARERQADAQERQAKAQEDSSKKPPAIIINR